MKIETYKQFRGSMLCVITFALGCIVAFSGCATGTATRMDIGQNQYETGTGIYIEKQK
jgi:hypothetical protein|tara:strand:+ start:574 stop:747 length:174 start_codon:yes stop_codon:yes gene_type:complete